MKRKFTPIDKMLDPGQRSIQDVPSSHRCELGMLPISDFLGIGKKFLIKNTLHTIFRQISDIHSVFIIYSQFSSDFSILKTGNIPKCEC